MPYSGRLSQSVTLHIRTPGAEDEHGVPAEVENDQVVSGFAGNQFASEGQQGQVTGEQRRLFLEAGAPIDGWDACTILGDKYEVIGVPWQVWNPRTGVVHHVEADIRRAGV